MKAITLICLVGRKGPLLGTSTESLRSGANFAHLSIVEAKGMNAGQMFNC